MKIRLTETQLKEYIGKIVSEHAVANAVRPQPVNEQSTMNMNEYSEGFMNKIIDKFKQEASSEVEMYVNRFKEISQNLKNRDITTYSWDQLKQTVDSYVDGSQKDHEKNIKQYIDREVERKYGGASKGLQDRYRDEMSTQMADEKKDRTPDWKNRLNN